MVAVLFPFKPSLVHSLQCRVIFLNCKSDHIIPLLLKTHKRLPINLRLMIQMLNIAHKIQSWPESHLPAQPHLKINLPLSLCMSTTLALFTMGMFPPIMECRTYNLLGPTHLIPLSPLLFRFYLTLLPFLRDPCVTFILWLIVPFLSLPRTPPSPFTRL